MLRTGKPGDITSKISAPSLRARATATAPSKGKKGSMAPSRPVTSRVRALRSRAETSEWSRRGLRLSVVIRSRTWSMATTTLSGVLPA